MIISIKIIFNTTFLLVLSVVTSIFFSTKVYAKDLTCFDKVIIEPGFIAFTTKKDSKLADWYQAMFGLNVVKEFSFPDGTVNGVLMNKKEFIVEIFKRDDALDKNDYVLKTKQGQWQGVMKFGVYTNANLPTLKRCLISRGIEAGRIFNDEKLHIDLLHVTDPEQNILEIISRTKVH